MNPRWLVAAVAAASVGAIAVRWRSDDDSSAARMAGAARAFLASLDDAQRARAAFAFADAERQKWHFVPGQYPGVPLSALGVEQRRRAHALMRSALSSAGYLKATTIFRLETVLREAAERAGRRADHRDPQRYAFAVFGEPSTEGPWGWRLQGHHLSLNFSSITGRVVVTTPSFFGANPAEVREGPFAGLRALGAEEDRGRALLASLTPEQREAAVLQDQAPSDILLAPGTALDRLGEPRGVAWAAMSEAQRALLLQLIAEYAGNLDRDFGRAQLERIRARGLDSIHFSWAGSLERGEPHYYRVHGPTFAIEYDNTQNGANHVHTVWHDLENDFGGDLLKAHYAAHGHAGRERR